MNETDRIEALKKFEILDTPPDGTFDDIVEIVTKSLNVPIGLITLVDEDRIWFKSKVGLDAVQISRDPGLCSSAILTNDIYEIENAPADPRTFANPLVAGEMGLKFYAAAPLTTKDGFNLGTLCVIDRQPRKLSPTETDLLKSLAKVVMNQMELRLQARQAIFIQNRLAQLVTHNLKGFVGTLPALSRIIKDEKDNSPKFEYALEILEKESEKHYSQIVSFLEQSSRFISDVTYDFKVYDLNMIVSSIVNTNKILATKKGQEIEFHKDVNFIPVLIDKSRIGDAVDNLINNAIKFSHKSTKILISLNKINSKAVFEISDQGLGLNEEDKALLFKRFSKLSAAPTGEELSSGIGLWMTKEIIDAHKGTISAESEGVNRGSTFTFELPTIEV